MRRVLSGVLLSAAAFLPASVAPRLGEAPATEHGRDPRMERLRAFFGEAGSPALTYAETFLDAADRNLLDWRLLPSISYLESTGGKTARNNNLFGWDSGREKFASPTDGIHAVAYLLSHSQRYRDKNLDQKLAAYNPDKRYSNRIKAVMMRISLYE